MLQVQWLESADADLDAIVQYIGQYNIDAAERMWHRLHNSVLTAAEYPLIYRVSEKVPGTREIQAHANYRVFYRVVDDHIEVVKVAHVRRNFPLSA